MPLPQKLPGVRNCDVIQRNRFESFAELEWLEQCGQPIVNIHDYTQRSHNTVGHTQQAIGSHANKLTGTSYSYSSVEHTFVLDAK